MKSGFFNGFAFFLSGTASPFGDINFYKQLKFILWLFVEVEAG
jgi:hypothetical protein